MSSGGAVEEIKSRLDIVEVIGQYVRLQRAGREWRGLCPFHTEHTPSFYVSPEKQVWNCHGCHQGGDLFQFVELILPTDFRGALEELARRAGVDLEADRGQSPADLRRRQQREALLRLNRLAEDFYHHVLRQTPAGEPGRRFLEERGIGEAEQERFKLGYAPLGSSRNNLVRFLIRHQASPTDLTASGLARAERGQLSDFFRQRITIPIRDEGGRTLGFGGRAVSDATPKYLNTRNTSLYDKSRLVFGLDLAKEAIRRERRTVLVEGYFDVIGCHRAEVGNAVSTSGTALTEAQVRLLRRFGDEVVVAFDGDQAGRRAAEAAAALVAAAGMNCRLISLDDGEDPDDLSRRDPSRLRQLVQLAPPAWEVLVDRALGDASPRPGAAGQEALRRAIPVLRRIPEASIRALYAERVGRRLGVDGARVLRDAERPGGAPPEPPREGGLKEQVGGQVAMGASAHLLAMLWLHPQLLEEVRDRYQVHRDDFPDERDGELFEVMAQAAPERLDLAELSPELRSRVEQLPRGGFPELAPDAEPERRDRSLRDYVSRVRLESLEERAEQLRRELQGLEHHRSGAAPQLVAELERLQQRIAALRHPGAGEG